MAAPKRRLWRPHDFEAAVILSDDNDSVAPIGARIIDTEEPSCDLWLCGRRIGNYPCNPKLKFGAVCPVCGTLFTVTFKWAFHWDFKHKATSVTVSWIGEASVHVPL